MKGSACVVRDNECRGRLERHHVRARGMGGAWGDYLWESTESVQYPSARSGTVMVGNTVCLCARHHNELTIGGKRTFERRYGVDLRALARNG